MTSCPKCGEKLDKPRKAWNYGVFQVKGYVGKCGAQFNEYYRGKDLKFRLIRQKGFLWKKV